ncbi:hypothetical protein [Mycobacterium kubicae]|uniref:Uncharacterized protein n=1 Tax=Mycobacterium kubicae TaxID=120959 RepID=A0AAX1JFS3_9MYCO|nr:hypothetical protein [Mycobacterium kubicae]MCV7095432.1 hypothetical protein [Mycobacterium kubicae]QPI40066.1 hypothetical protein I2456_11840 [Mycobacterium kubicae]
MTTQHLEYLADQYLADHGIWLAIPAFLPAIIVVGVVLYIAMRNRRSSNQKQD